MLPRISWLIFGLLHLVIASCCVVTWHGARNETILRGIVVSPSGPLRDGYVHIRNGKIIDIGKQYGSDANRCGAATIIDCGSSVISPGLINAHEHIEYSLICPLPRTSQDFGARHDWRMGYKNKPKIEPQVIPGSEHDASVWGELRHLFSGTTSIVGEGYAAGLTRNLDRAYGFGEDLHGSADSMQNFPLDDRAGILRLGDCDYGPNAVTQGATDGLNRYIAHVGEGVSAEALNEFRCLSSRTFDTTARADGSGVSVDIVAPNLVMVQANSLTKEDFDLVASRGAMVVWSPRSNIALYGSTLNVTYLLEIGINVALGTDWLPTGSATMSREAHCGAAAMKLQHNTTIEAKLLWQMMTINAARATGFENQIGSLEVDKLADLAVWSGGDDDDDEELDVYSQAIFSPTESLELVMRGGQIMLASSTLDPILPADECERVFFGAAEKFVCVKRELNTSFAAFQSALQEKYPIVLPPVIIPGVPLNEPSCEPVLG